MNVAELADHIAAKHGMEKKQAKTVIDAIFTAMADSAKKGEEVSIPGAAAPRPHGPQPGHGRDHPDRRLQEVRLHARQAAEGRHES